MKLPNLSFMMKVGQIRYIQSVYEAAGFRNPDTLVRDLLPMLQRWGCDMRGRILLSGLRSQPFYYYILARTMYYDAVFIDAIYDRVNYIVNIGCGSDTRAYRFAHILKHKGVKVLECDQPEAIRAKRQLVSRNWPIDQVEYLAIDLNLPGSWKEFELWLGQNLRGKLLVLMEGVSPYINQEKFGQFLEMLAATIQPGSRIAYDFKLRDVANDFGHSEQTSVPFRLSGDRREVTAYHEAFGFELEHFELSADLSLRLLPDLANSTNPVFREDGLVQLLLPNRANGSSP